MDFDREYRRPGQHMTPDDFTDSNVQALVEGRRKNPLPTPNLASTDEMLRQLRSLETTADQILTKWSA